MVCREVETGGSCTAGFQWRQLPGAIPTLVLVESTTPSNWPVALKCVAAASIRTYFRVPRCALVAKLNRAHHLPKLVGRILTHRVYDFGALRLLSLASLFFFSLSLGNSSGSIRFLMFLRLFWTFLLGSHLHQAGP